jgi:hypothetical protein
MRSRNEPNALCRWAVLAALLIVTALATGPAWGQTEETGETAFGGLLGELEEHFRILRLRHGVVLEPREDIDGVRTVEVVDGRFAIDGSDVSARDLGRRLGALAAPVIRLADLGENDLDTLFRGGGAGAMEVSAPVAPRAPPAPPAREERSSRSRARYRSGDDTQLVVGNDLTVERGEVARDAVVFGGTLRVEGEVIGDAVAIGGSAVVEGKVTGDVAVIGGRARIEDGAEILGNVVNVGGEIDIADGARIEGEIIELPFGPEFSFRGWPMVFQPDWGGWGGDWFDFSPWSHFFGMIWRFFGLVLLALLACLAWLLARRPVERIGVRLATEPWKSGLVGLAAQVLFLPLLVLVVLILLVSIIGIPLLLLVPFALVALVVIAFLGYVAVAHRLGLWARERFGWRLESPYVVLLVGLAILQVWTFLGAALDLGGGPIRLFAAMFLVFGFCVKYFAWTVGLGAALLTRFGTSATWDRSLAGPPGIPPMPPGGGSLDASYQVPDVPSGYDVRDVPAEPTVDDGRPFWEREGGAEEPEAPAAGDSEDEPEKS